MRFKIDRASLIVGSKFKVFALFYFVFEGNFPSTSPRGAYIWRGDLTEGFFRYWFGGLIFGGAYTWRGLFSEFYGMLITYKVLHDRASIYIQELLQLYTPSCNLRSSNRNLLVKPYFNLNSYGKRAFFFSVAASELWNYLPEDIKSANSIYDFKRKLKTFLFMRAYEP